jgi:hypothetical protein
MDGVLADGKTMVVRGGVTSDYTYELHLCIDK